jgi:hypothetical protein
MLSAPLLAAALAWLLGAPQSDRPTEIRIHLPTHECAAPCAMEVTVSIPHNPDNRSASVVWSYDRSTELPLGGDNPQTEFHAAIGTFAPGTHTVYAVLVREKNGRRDTFEDSERVTVR